MLGVKLSLAGFVQCGDSDWGEASEVEASVNTRRSLLRKGVVVWSDEYPGVGDGVRVPGGGEGAISRNLIGGLEASEGVGDAMRANVW